MGWGAALKGGECVTSLRERSHVLLLLGAASRAGNGRDMFTTPDSAPRSGIQHEVGAALKGGGQKGASVRRPKITTRRMLYSLGGECIICEGDLCVRDHRRDYLFRIVDQFLYLFIREVGIPFVTPLVCLFGESVRHFIKDLLHLWGDDNVIVFRVERDSVVVCLECKYKSHVSLL